MTHPNRDPDECQLDLESVRPVDRTKIMKMPPITSRTPSSGGSDPQIRSNSDFRAAQTEIRPDSAGRLKIGAVNYLNSKPLIEGLEELVNPWGDLRLDYPSRLADDLAAGRLDVALIPSIEYFRGQNYEVISDACVAAHGPVLSVKLYSRVPWGDIRSLALDEGSRTSATLVRVLLAERHGVFPKLRPLPLDHRTEETDADAILLIGDRAISPPAEKFRGTWDLGEEWFQWTGLPFVFAMWVSRQGVDTPGNSPPPARGKRGQTLSGHSISESDRLPSKGSDPFYHGLLAEIEEMLSRSRDLGVDRLDDIARREAPLLGLSLPTTISYLSENLQYRLGPAERNGLKLYYELAAGLGLAPEGVELRFRTSEVGV
ncbi:MAG: menaquinone biosynthesis protein [Planctomycetaceae bacterium]